MLNKAAVVFALAAACLSPLTGAASELRGIVDRTIQPLMARHDIPGMSVALTVNGRTEIFHYGLASRADKLPVTDATLFELGSISKVFTAMLVAHAQESGKLSLSDHPGKYMPELEGKPIDQATLFHLGTYTAGGLPLQFPADVAGDADSPRYFQQWKARFAPGTQREYSNPSLGLFGHLAALAVRQPFAQAMETRVLAPLGLKHTFIGVPGNAMPNYAWGYDRSNKAIRMNPGPLAEPAYGLRSTAADMVRFVEANMNPARLPAPMPKVVAATQLAHFQVGVMKQGLGWESYDYPIAEASLLAGNSETMIWQANPAVRIAPGSAPAAPALFNKTGSTGGFGNYIAFVPSEKIGIVMLANKNYPIPARISAAYAILQQVR
jgi:beta-lactamase class C